MDLANVDSGGNYNDIDAMIEELEALEKIFSEPSDESELSPVNNDEAQLPQGKIIPLHTAQREEISDVTVSLPETGNNPLPEMDLDSKKKATRKPKANESGLMIYYEPVIQPMLNKTIAYEASVMLVDKKLGNISYNEFMPIVEKSDINVLLEQWIFEETCSMLQKMIKKEIEFEYVAVNVSARNLKKKNYISNLLKTINNFGIPPEKICLVITESVLNVDVEIIFEKMHELKRAGLKIALDNYNASNIPLSILDSVPADMIKLDRAITDRIFIDKKTEENARAIIKQANNLNLEVVANGIGEEIQKYKLMVLGCKKMQGALFGNPLKDREVLNPKPYKKVMCPANEL